MTEGKYLGRFLIFSTFIGLFGNSWLKFNAEEIRNNKKFLNNSTNKIIWEEHNEKDIFFQNNKLEWEKYIPENYIPDNIIEEPQNILNEDILEKNLKIDSHINKKEFFYLGFAVPNADLINKKEFMIYAEQLFPLYKSDLEEGTGNQNYSVFLSYGINDDLMLMGFFSHSDDPLYNKINNIEKQPANKWISVGVGSRLNLFKKYNFSTSLDTSLETWYVKSGGCNGIGCGSNSSNIFDKSLNEFKNLNLIGSIALPTTYKISKKTNIVFTPKVTFLPEEQIEKTGSGPFYGFNTGIGLGFNHEFTKKFQVYNSTYIPLSGENYFDKNLNFKKAIIYDFGLSYSIDPKISFQSYLTNSFGATPATGILTIPSDNNLIIGTRLVYKPTSKDYEGKKYIKNNYLYDGLSVSNSGIIKPNEILLDISLDKDAGTWTTIKTGLSRNFNFEISTGKSINKSKVDNYYFNEYIGSNLYNLRFGGKAILIDQNAFFPITSGIRMTFGRTIGETWPGYLFLENINTISISKRIQFNLTPKIAWTGSDNPSAIGSSLIFNINDYYSILLENNTALRNAESNFTTALRISPNKNRYFDLFITDAVNFNDIGELVNAQEISYGFKLGFKF